MAAWLADLAQLLAAGLQLHYKPERVGILPVPFDPEDTIGGLWCDRPTLGPDRWSTDLILINLDPDPIVVAAALAHELIHASHGRARGHGDQWQTEMKRVGLEPVEHPDGWSQRIRPGGQFGQLMARAALDPPPLIPAPNVVVGPIVT